MSLIVKDYPGHEEEVHEINALRAGHLFVQTKDEPIDHLRVHDYFRMLCRWHDEIFDVAPSGRFDTSVGDEALVRTVGVSGAPISETFSTVIGNTMVEASENEPSTCDGWVGEGGLPNYLGSTWYTQEFASRLERLTKGETAQQSSFGTKAGEPIKLVRMATQFVVDERDWIDSTTTVGAIKLAASELAAAPVRAIDNAGYSLILANATLNSDSTTLFHANHHNLASGAGSALSATSVDTAIGAMGRQVFLAETDKYPEHYNLRARYLIVPPELVGPALRLVRNLDTEKGPKLEVRMESRLSDLGTVDPISGTLYKGSATNWLLTAKASARPSIVVAGLNGSPKPEFRRFNLDRGRFGIGWDVRLDVCVVAVDYRGVYFSVGA
jgi:hypothetical protein